VAWAELAGLCALAIAEPIFEEIQQGITVFASHESRGREAVVLTIALVAVPPIVLWLIELGAGLVWPRARRIVHAALVSFLVASMVWQAAHGDSLEGSRFATFALIASFCGALALYLRTVWMPAVTRLLALAVPVVAIGFLASAPANRLFGGGPPGPPRAGDAPPVVLIVFDELPLATLIGPDGEIDRRLFPNFAGLADESTWYRATRTVADQTRYAVPAILAGKSPEKELIPSYSDYPQSIFGLLAAQGSVADGETATDLCGPSICVDRFSIQHRIAEVLRLGSGAAVTLPLEIVDSVSRRLSEATTPAILPPPFETFISGLAAPAETRPSLAVAHVPLPHAPWTRLPSGQTYPDPGMPGLNLERWRGPDYLVELGFQRHVLQAQSADRELGRAMRTMRRSGLYQDAVFAVTADHGAAFLPDFSRRGTNGVTAGWVLPVPFLVKAPGQRSGKVDPRPLRTIDVLPTLAAAAGVEIPWETDGRAPGAPRDPEIDGGYLTFQQAGRARIASADVDDALDRAIALRNRLLEGGTAFALGGAHDLIGRPAAALGTRPLASRRDSPSLDAVDPHAAQVNAYASGLLPGYAGSPGDPIAFVLNGRVAATGRVFGQWYSSPRFATVLPIPLMRPGRNRLEVYPLGTSPRGGGRRRASAPSPRCRRSGSCAGPSRAL
jgi:hypothetical protein